MCKHRRRPQNMMPSAREGSSFSAVTTGRTGCYDWESTQEPGDDRAVFNVLTSFGFLRQGFLCVALKRVLELTL